MLVLDLNASNATYAVCLRSAPKLNSSFIVSPCYTVSPNFMESGSWSGYRQNRHNLLVEVLKVPTSNKEEQYM